MGETDKGRITPMRAAIARTTSTSFSTIPHFYLNAELDIEPALAKRKELTKPIRKACGIRPTLTDFILRAMVLAMKDCPYANCVWDQTNGRIRQYTAFDVGLVVGLPGGVLIPEMRNAGAMDFVELIMARHELVEAARVGKIPASALLGCATTLSNLGTTRVDDFAAIIPQRGSSMLSTGRIARRPWVVGEELCVRQTIRLTLPVDHRVMDGLQGAEFLGRIVERLEKVDLELST